ncbi:MAG: intradiol ring-cleavage dioxygenase [Chloroflexi bacterium]|nr:intradiol ring-cleavage dioxygenase [Chloroflexota bacterium]
MLQAEGSTELETGIQPRQQSVPLNPNPVPARGPRRRFFRKIGLLGAAVLAGCRFRAPVDSDHQVQTPAPITDEPVCVLTPRATEGPFHFDTKLVRRDIIEDRAGIPLHMAVRVVAVDSNCEPLQGAFVDLWHADAAGAYSGYPGQPGGLDTSGQTFLRGIQITDVDGIVRFDTIYPGWYPGRAVHIHFKVHYENNSYLTSQFYFPDEISDRVFKRPPYSDRPNRAIRNADDSVLRIDSAEGNLLASITEDSAGHFGEFTVGLAL